DDSPALELRQRAGLHDLDQIALVRRVCLVMRMADGAAPEQLAVLGMRHEPLDDHPSSLVHLVGGYHADFGLAAALSDNRLGFGWGHRTSRREIIVEGLERIARGRFAGAAGSS